MIVYENPWFRVEKDGAYHYVAGNTGGEGAVILPIIGQSLLLLQMQRVSQGLQTTLEIPRGFGNAGEGALMCAQRELREETGYALPIEDFTLLGHVRPDTGIQASRVAVFSVQIDPYAIAGPTDKEAKGRTLLALDDLPAAMRDGQIEDGFTLSALALWSAFRR